MPTTDAKSIIGVRDRLVRSIKKIEKSSMELTNNITLSEAENSLQYLQHCFEKFTLCEDQLIGRDDKDIISVYNETEDVYIKTTGKLKQFIYEKSSHDIEGNLNESMNKLVGQQQLFLEQMNNVSVGNIDKDTRLPKLSIPTFNGQFRDWFNFHDLFRHSVHEKTSLPKAQKLQYLKGLLRGEAANLVSHLVISDENYDHAWNKLTARYNRKGPLINSFIELFYSQPVMVAGNANSVQHISDICDEVVRALAALDNQSRDPFMIYSITRKMDNETKLLWARETQDDDNPTVQTLIKFLNQRSHELSVLQSKDRNFHYKPGAQEVKGHVSSISSCCPACRENHYLYRCSTFRNLGIPQRQQIVQEANVCENCLNYGHQKINCKSAGVCWICKDRHHTLLHPVHRMQETNNLHATPEFTSDTNQQSCDQPSTQQLTFGNDSSQPINSQPVHGYQATGATSTKYHISLLPTALILVRDKQGKHQTCRALLDSGSQATFISLHCADRLMLSRRHAKIPITGLAAAGAGVTKGIMQLELSSRINTKSKIFVDALILTKLTTLLPCFDFNVNWDTISNVELADPQFNKSSPIDIIIGADIFFQVLSNERMMSTPDTPAAQNTIFGWVLAGNCNINNHRSVLSLHSLTEKPAEADIDTQLKRFWELEEICTGPFFTEEEKACEIHFVTTHQRDNGRYMVRLPFRESSTELGNSLQMAVSRLKSMERRFQRNPTLKTEYRKFIDEYLSLNHMSEIPYWEANKLEKDRVYLPHHAVIREDSSSTKLRVVFDGSAKTTTNSSLNDMLMVGPTIQPTLSSILIKFRCPLIVFAADIHKMFRQILIDPRDRDFQCIVWRDEPNQPIKHFRLNTVTYGLSSSPFLAARTIKQIATDYEKQYPMASKLIQSNFYVDDIMAGADREEEVEKLIQDLIHILGCSGLELRKWKTNKQSILKNIPEEHQDPKYLGIEENGKSVKVLGIFWDPKLDCFSFHSKPSHTHNLTKRTILSDAARVFDPMGWLSPLTVSMKIMFQSLWKERLDWDETVPSYIAEKWNQTRRELHHVESIKIPRALTVTKNKDDVYEMHGFCDSSEAAYAAVVYLKTLSSNGRFTIRLISAKTKVAPMKIISMPRLELCGAQLLAKLITSLLKDLQYNKIKVFAWCDSKTVLAWLSRHPRDWKPFIANRTSNILEQLPRNHWNYVKSAENPADLASRGVTPIQLPTLELWWNGPTWLAKSQIEYNTESEVSCFSPAAEVELKKSGVQSNTVTVEVHFLSELFQRLSSWSKLIKVVSYIYRVVDRANGSCINNKIVHNSQYISAAEYFRATATIVKYVQSVHFEPELKALQRADPLPRNSNLIKLYPVLGDDGILRVGGRLQNSLLANHATHPAIIPKEHKISKLIIDFFHKSNLHPGPSLTIYIIRQHYWIINCRRLVNSYIHNCITCFRQSNHESNQLMGSLPAYRVQPSRRAFVHVGIDYAGPITTKLMKGRCQKQFKSYICVFVCLTSKAIHLEPVSELTTEAFIATLKRFVSRRGIPSLIVSDNAKNFVGAKNEIIKIMKHEAVNNFSTKLHITWQFITPLCPHQGGIWEAGVRSMKHHLKRTTQGNIFTFEELCTILTQIEAVLNSRPLCSLTDDVDDINCLTPSHILIGEPLRNLPEPSYTEAKMNVLNSWQRCQKIVQTFWSRWQKEYLNNMQLRKKWNSVKSNLNENDLVIIKDDGLPPGLWRIGRIIGGIKSQAGQIRNYDVKTSTGVYKRNITKLVKLPIETV